MHVHVLSIQLKTNGYVNHVPSSLQRYPDMTETSTHTWVRCTGTGCQKTIPFLLLTHVSAKTSSTCFLLSLVLHHVNASIVLIIGL